MQLQERNGHSEQINCYNFKNSGSYGQRIQRADAWTFVEVHAWGNNYHGAVLGGYDPSPAVDKSPTEIRFLNCYIKQNLHRGIEFRTGIQIDFLGGSSELNGDEAWFGDTTYAQVTNPLQDVVARAYHFENNHTNQADARTFYHVRIDGHLIQNAIRGFEWRACTFFVNNNLNSPKGADLYEVRDFVIDSPKYFSALAGVFKLRGVGAGGIITNWPSTGGDVSTVVTDTAVYGANSYDTETKGTFTPVLDFATHGDLVATLSTAVANWYRNGKKVKEVIDIQTSTFTHTAAAAGNLRITGSPWTALNSAGLDVQGVCNFQGYTKAGYTQITAQKAANTSYYEFLAGGSGQPLAALARGDMPSAGTVIIRLVNEFEIA
jgi:hypothetical protein